MVEAFYVEEQVARELLTPQLHFQVLELENVQVLARLVQLVVELSQAGGVVVGEFLAARALLDHFFFFFE
jgi:hypothetical protein